MYRSLILLGLAAAASCLPASPPSLVPTPVGPVDAPRHNPRVDHPPDLLDFSGRLAAAVAPLLDAFLMPFVESLPEDYLERLAESIKNDTVPGLNQDVRYFEDEDKLQLHEDFKNNVIGSDTE